MPVFGIGDALVGALTISGPVSRLTPVRAGEVKGMLTEAAHKLTAAWRGHATGRVPNAGRGPARALRPERNAVLN